MTATITRTTEEASHDGIPQGRAAHVSARRPPPLEQQPRTAVLAGVTHGLPGEARYLAAEAVNRLTHQAASASPAPIAAP